MFMSARLLQAGHKSWYPKQNQRKKGDHQPSFACIAIYYYDTWMDGERVVFALDRRFIIYICWCKRLYAWHSNCETDMDTLDTNNNWFYAYEIRASDQVFHLAVYRWLISMFSVYFGANRINCAACIFKVNVIYMLLRCWLAVQIYGV